MPYNFEQREKEKESKQPSLNMNKRYVDVVCKHNSEGVILPLKIIWDEMNIFLIDRVLDISKAASLKAGGTGIRYRCRILSRETNLFYDIMEEKWFVEAKHPQMEVVKENI